jgi:dihydroflavonol-4-reductase
MTRALITGCTGCVGSNLARALVKRGIEVIGFSYYNAPTITLEGVDIQLVEGDILDPATLPHAMKGVDWVFHVAGIADDWRHKADAIYKTNVEGTRNVLTAAHEAGVKRFVWTSSAAVLGAPRKNVPMLDETFEFNIKPVDWVYAHSKVLAEKALLEFVAKGMQALSVLPTAVMGPGDMNFICGSLITRALQRKIFPFPSGGNNFVDARDLAEAQIAAAERGVPGERYLIGGENMSHLHCFGTIGDALGVPIKYLYVPRFVLPIMSNYFNVLRWLGITTPIDRIRVILSGTLMHFDTSKAVRELGLKTRPFSETVHDTYQWYLDHDMLNDCEKSPPVFPPIYGG